MEHHIDALKNTGEMLPSPLRLRHIKRETLNRILESIALPNNVDSTLDIGPVTQLLSCFYPVRSPSDVFDEAMGIPFQTYDKAPDSLLDQVGEAFADYRHLSSKDRANCRGLISTLLWTIANTPQSHGRVDTNECTRGRATIALQAWEKRAEEMVRKEEQIKQSTIKKARVIAARTALSGIAVAIGLKLASCSPQPIIAVEPTPVTPISEVVPGESTPTEGQVLPTYTDSPSENTPEPPVIETQESSSISLPLYQEGEPALVPDGTTQYFSQTTLETIAGGGSVEGVTLSQSDAQVLLGNITLLNEFIVRQPGEKPSGQTVLYLLSDGTTVAIKFDAVFQRMSWLSDENGLSLDPYSQQFLWEPGTLSYTDVQLPEGAVLEDLTFVRVREYYTVAVVGGPDKPFYQVFDPTTGEWVDLLYIHVDIADPLTFPAWAQEYMATAEEAQEDAHVRFDRFIQEARVSHLVRMDEIALKSLMTSGDLAVTNEVKNSSAPHVQPVLDKTIEELNGMTGEQLDAYVRSLPHQKIRWLILQEQLNAASPQPVILSRQDLIDMRTDPQNAFAFYTWWDAGAQSYEEGLAIYPWVQGYHIYGYGGSWAVNGAELLIRDWKEYPNILGSEQEVLGLSDEHYGDIWGVSPALGREGFVYLVLREIDDTGKQSLRVDIVATTPTTAPVSCLACITTEPQITFYSECGSVECPTPMKNDRGDKYENISTWLIQNLGKNVFITGKGGIQTVGDTTYYAKDGYFVQGLYLVGKIQ